MLSVELETEDGPLMLQITAKAANDLRGLFKNVPAVGEWPETQKL